MCEIWEEEGKGSDIIYSLTSAIFDGVSSAVLCRALARTFYRTASRFIFFIFQDHIASHGAAAYNRRNCYIDFFVVLLTIFFALFFILSFANRKLLLDKLLKWRI